MVFSSHLCRFFSRLLQRWNWTWYIWLSLVFGTNAVYQAFIYGLTLSMMTFAYALILIVTLLILLINIQPYKKTFVRYPSTDTIFFILLALFFSALLGMDLSTIESSIYGTILFIICVISACVPLFYITFFVFSWLIKTKRRNKAWSLSSIC